MKKLAFLSTDNLDGFFVYDDLLHAPFAQQGWHIDTISWHQRGVDWNDYEAVIVRSTWDYQQYPDAFLNVLEEIDNSSARLENPLKLQCWNLHKTYLQDLEKKGLTIIPTVWANGFRLDSMLEQFSKWETDTLIVKPTLSANADDTFKVVKSELSKKQSELVQLFDNRNMMIQPFIPEILSEGEYSLFYFDSQFSHAILKQPAKGDFRVQEEHGGKLFPIKPDEKMLQTGGDALVAMPTSALYARVDLIRFNGQWAVMELELIEPSLYFTLDAKSPQRFVDAFLRRMNH